MTTANTDAQRLSRLVELDTNTVSDALDFLELPGATLGLRPLWQCPKIVGRASTIQLAPKQADSGLTVHPITSVIAQSVGDDRILVIAGGIEGVSCWGDIVANAAAMKHIRGTVIDGFSRDIEGSEQIGYPVYGRGVTMVSARNRLVQTGSGEPVVVAGVRVAQDDFVIADRCGSVFVPAARIDEVLDIAQRTAAKQAGMVSRVRAGQSVAEAMHDRNFAAVMEERQS
ncbi:RraA family protein [Variovorax sp. RCC_210]|uniref:RraA family protein n=1 Tax=Variovorax sp. RCC_210 TaxID=3239217 RepID=UPI0035259280